MYELEVSDTMRVGYLADARGQLARAESDLLAIEKEGQELDEKRINRVFRTVHSIKGASSFFDLIKVGELAQQTENVLALVRSRKLVPAPDSIRVLLRATDRLSELLQNPDSSNQADISEFVTELTRLYEANKTPLRTNSTLAGSKEFPGGRPLRALLVEDDFCCRLLLQKFLSRYGDCHIAVNGREAVEAVRSALDCGQGYDMICMDIMMPEMDGREAVRQVRALEEARGIFSTHGVRIFMTTTVDNIKEVILCFNELCDAYLMKPVDLGKLLDHMKSYQLVQ
jgi:two-component system chemotaxis response regulator CheY